MDENRKTLQQWVDESSNIVFFGGAGMSTAARMVCIISATMNHLRPSSLTAILSAIRINSIGFTEIR